MFVTPAFAQTGAAPGPDLLVSILPFVLIFVIMYFLIIRPQRQQMKQRTEMLKAVRRGDTVVTGGGLVGKITKVTNDNELEIDLGGGMKVTAVRSTIAEVRVKGEPVANQNAKSDKPKSAGAKNQGAKGKGAKSGTAAKSQAATKDDEQPGAEAGDDQSGKS